MAAAKKKTKKVVAKAKPKTTKAATKVIKVTAKAKKLKAAPEPVVVAKKPKRPAKANKAPPVPHKKTLDMTDKPPPPKPKATISVAKAIALANTFLKDNIGKGDLYAPRASKFRLGSILERSGIINVCFCHEMDHQDASMAELGAKCVSALVEKQPQLKAFNIEVQMIRM